MNRYVVTFSATEQIPIEANNEQDAHIKARAKLDPDVDWDCDGIDDVTDNPDLNWMFE
jgi:hypothetical protein